jgi:ribosomal protein S18 acetylase RimI-like enzyme
MGFPLMRTSHQWRPTISWPQSPPVLIRPAAEIDRAGIWAVIEPHIRAGETFAMPRGWSREEGLSYWFAPAHEVFVAEAEGAIVGTYYLRANQAGGGDHVANAGYATAPEASGRGVARAMGEHSLDVARQRGFAAMQFNLVVSSNERAVRLWQSLGFRKVGTLPGAFRHPSLGHLDSFVMWRDL